MQSTDLQQFICTRQNLQWTVDFIELSIISICRRLSYYTIRIHPMLQQLLLITLGILSLFLWTFCLLGKGKPFWCYSLEDSIFTDRFNYLTSWFLKPVKISGLTITIVQLTICPTWWNLQILKDKTIPELKRMGLRTYTAQTINSRRVITSKK